MKCESKNKIADSKTGILLPFGERANGQIVHISEVRNGLSCECVRPHCKARLVARKGPQKQHHFGHYASTECRHAYESAIHKLAKEILCKEKKIKIPEVKAEYMDMKEIIQREIIFELDEARLEEPISGIIPDVVALKRDRKLLIEIAVTHFCDSMKITKIRENNLSTIEVDLSQLSRDATALEIEEALLYSAPRAWVY